MITLKSNWLIGSITAIVLLFGFFFIVNAVEKNKVPTATVVSTTWHFTGNSEAEGQYRNVDNWELGPAAPETCETEGQKPCEITANATNKAQLSSYFGSMNNAAVLAINPSSRRE